MVENADVVVIGMGPGGEGVAGSLAEAGLRVIGVEQALVGGEWPLLGMRAQQDDDPGGRPVRRGQANT